MSTTAEEMFAHFTKIIENNLAKHAPLKSLFIRNDKQKFSLYQKWVNNSTKRTYQCNQSKISNSFQKDNDKHLLEIFQELKNYKARWKFIQEMRNSKK